MSLWNKQHLTTFEAQLKKLSNPEAELKNMLLIKKACMGDRE